MGNLAGTDKLVVVGRWQIKFAVALVGLLVATVFDVSPVHAQSAETYDIVLQGGRVMDPETGLDAIRNVGIRGDQIAEISESELEGKVILNVSGFVVAPGFVDLHAHGQTNQANEYQVHDGVTTALELESGKAYLRHWLASREGNALINYGASVSHPSYRALNMERYAEQARAFREIVERDGPFSSQLDPLRSEMSGVAYEGMTRQETEAMVADLKRELRAGGLGIGVPLGYYPGASRDEIFRVFQFAAENETIIFTHIRDSGVPEIQEVIANASVTGASLHIVHLNSQSLGKIRTTLDMIDSAQRQGLDITTEVYPYTAASTGLGSARFDEGWKERWGISYGDLQWVATGERLTEESFKRYRETGGTVIIHMMQPEWIEMGIQAPFVMIASDGMPYAQGAHPRSAGTFSRVLGRYAREMGTISLMDALRKMTIMPARRLEDISPMMSRKGRIQVGSDADITVFDPDTVIDTATFEEDLSFSEGIHHVIVNGTFVVKNTKTVLGVYPGRPILGKYRR